ncbi:hypothetical protein BJV74DRAFT_368117 [Russula compacta]|nr:hypothetical protein BJV74DRAFT_368117 [Russula compacta]
MAFAWNVLALSFFPSSLINLVDEKKNNNKTGLTTFAPCRASPVMLKSHRDNKNKKTDYTSKARNQRHVRQSVCIQIQQQK